MRDDLKIALDLFINTYKDLNAHSLSDNLLIGFLKFENQYEEVKSELKANIGIVNRLKFENIYDVDELRVSIDRKKEHLMERCKSARLEDEIYEPSFVDEVDETIEKVRFLYENYAHQTFHNREREVKLKPVIGHDRIDLHNKLLVTARDLVLLTILEEVKGQLEFNEFYNPEKKIIKEKPTDACWYEMENNPDLTKEELVKIVLEKYWFLSYEEELDRKKVKRKLTKAVRAGYDYIAKKWKEEAN